MGEVSRKPLHLWLFTTKIEFIFKYAGNCCCGSGGPSTPHHGPNPNDSTSQTLLIALQLVIYFRWHPPWHSCYRAPEWSTGELGWGTGWDETRQWQWNQTTMTTRSAMPTVTSLESFYLFAAAKPLGRFLVHHWAAFFSSEDGAFLFIARTAILAPEDKWHQQQHPRCQCIRQSTWIVVDWLLDAAISSAIVFYHCHKIPPWQVHWLLHHLNATNRVDRQNAKLRAAAAAADCLMDVDEAGIWHWPSARWKKKKTYRMPHSSVVLHHVVNLRVNLWRWK